MRSMAEVNITPLIDVLLVLLIIFMVAVPAAQRTLGVAVPQPSSADPSSPPPPGPPVLEVEADRYKLGPDTFASLDDLERGLALRLSLHREPVVIVRSAAGVRYGRVMEVMDVARGLGATRIGIVSGRPALPAAELE
jgi:biopolymer transport protein ExbD